MSNAYIHSFRPNHQYFSFYPYYLPSYYSNYYPKHYNRYYEPVSHLSLKKGPLYVESTTIDIFNVKNLLKILVIIAVIYFITKKLFMR